MGLLQSSCREMKFGTKQRLAIHLASCHLEEGGRPSVRCPDSEVDVSVCMRKIKDDVAWQTMTEFLFFAESFCQSLQADAWRMQTEALITGLGRQAVETVELLHTSSDKQTEMIHKLQDAKHLQEVLNDAQLTLHTEMEASTQQFTTLTSEVAMGFQTVGGQYETLVELQEAHLQRQTELLANLQKANEEVKIFTERMEAEFAKEAHRFGLLRDVLAHASLVLEVAVHGWRLASVGIAVAALWILAPRSVFVYVRKFAAGMVLVATLLGLLRSLQTSGRHLWQVPEEIWRVFEGGGTSDGVKGDGGGGGSKGGGGGGGTAGVWFMMVLLIGFWYLLPANTLSAWLWKRHADWFLEEGEGEEEEEAGHEYGRFQYQDNNNNNWTPAKERALREAATRVVLTRGGAAAARGASMASSHSSSGVSTPLFSPPAEASSPPPAPFTPSLLLAPPVRRSSRLHSRSSSPASSVSRSSSRGRAGGGGGAHSIASGGMTTVDEE